MREVGMEKKLSDLVIGDKVIVSFCGDKIISTVDKVTDTLIFVNGTSYSKNDGVSIYFGRNDYTDRIEVATEEKNQMIEKNKLKDEIINEINDFDFDSLNYEQIKQMHQILNNN